jgi:hypothetical protein
MTDPFGPKRDRWGRYMLPDPDTGKERAWTRATTLASTLADTYGLTQWQMRMVAKGLGMRPDLMALAAAAHVDDKDTLNRVAADAKEAAGSSAGANAGTAVHSFTEAVDRGEDINVPEPWAADIEAYRAALAGHNITVTPDWIERITVVPALNVAGTFDRILTLPDGKLVIGDVKTGKDLAYSWCEISIQLALYANATHMWSVDHWEPMPPVDLTEAIVIWLPVGKGRCELHRVDIAAGWEQAKVAFDVRKWRARKNLNTRIAVHSTADPMTQLRRTSAVKDLRLRIAAAGSVDELTTIWAEADTAGHWTSALTAAAAARKKALVEGNPSPTQPQLEVSA